MPNINDAFPSRYLKAGDLKNKKVALTIVKVETDTIGDESKLVVYFKGTDKGLVLNKTNANSIAVVTNSEDTDDWAGKKITLYPTKVEFQGKRVAAIRIEEPDEVLEEPIDDDAVPF